MDFTVTGMNERGKIDFSQIREFRCVGKKCKATTTNWFKDGWGIVGLSNAVPSPSGGNKNIPREPAHETESHRILLEAKNIIERNGLSCALLCPDHAHLAQGER